MPLSERTRNSEAGPADLPHDHDQAAERSAVMPDSKRAQAVFLHTGWRSGGTWAWSRFRTLPAVRAFYEPLIALLGELRAADIPSLRPTRNAGHPPLGAPYYEEYRSFIEERGRGVLGYRKRFSIDRFGVVPDDEFPAMQAYLQNLCDRSTQQGKVPVLKFCRSQGRLPWLRRAFPQALHGVVLRNPASQFASGWLLKKEWNPFFVAAPFRVLGLNQTEPVVKQAIEACGVSMPPVAPSSSEQYSVACEQYAQTVEGTNAYRAFIALWALCALRMVDGVDLVIDMDQIGQSSAYASELRRRFHEQTDLMPDFSGARNLLVEETKRRAGRMSGIDGRVLRSINFSAQKFVLSNIDSSNDSHAGIVEIIRQKLLLADEVSAQWRY